MLILSAAALAEGRLSAGSPGPPLPGVPRSPVAGSPQPFPSAGVIPHVATGWQERSLLAGRPVL